MIRMTLAALTLTAGTATAMAQAPQLPPMRGYNLPTQGYPTPTTQPLQVPNYLPPPPQYGVRMQSGPIISGPQGRTCTVLGNIVTCN